MEQPRHTAGEITTTTDRRSGLVSATAAPVLQEDNQQAPVATSAPPAPNAANQSAQGEGGEGGDSGNEGSSGSGTPSSSEEKPANFSQGAWNRVTDYRAAGGTIDVSGIKGSGAEGNVLVKDVEDAIEALKPKED